MANIIPNIIHLPWNQLELESSSKAIKRTAKAIKWLVVYSPEMKSQYRNQRFKSFDGSPLL